MEPLRVCLDNGEDFEAAGEEKPSLEVRRSCTDRDPAGLELAAGVVTRETGRGILGGLPIEGGIIAFSGVDGIEGRVGD